MLDLWVLLRVASALRKSKGDVMKLISASPTTVTLTVQHDAALSKRVRRQQSRNSLHEDQFDVSQLSMASINEEGMAQELMDAASSSARRRSARGTQTLCLTLSKAASEPLGLGVAGGAPDDDTSNVKPITIRKVWWVEGCLCPLWLPLWLHTCVLACPHTLTRREIDCARRGC